MEYLLELFFVQFSSSYPNTFQFVIAVKMVLNPDEIYISDAKTKSRNLTKFHYHLIKDKNRNNN